MDIISHRGHWLFSNQTTISDNSQIKTTNPPYRLIIDKTRVYSIEKNTLRAFERCFKLGLGTETDIRDYCGELVISHDIANRDNISVRNCLELYNNFNCTGTLALNIKADGLQEKLKELLNEYSIKNYFVFDMSIPDTIGYINSEIPFFSRQSEFEPIPSFYEECTGIWLDAFEGNWYGAGLIHNHLKKGKQVAIVSPDLHKHDPLPFWEYLRKEKIHHIEDVIICTDLPEDAQAFFE